MADRGVDVRCTYEGDRTMYYDQLIQLSPWSACRMQSCIVSVSSFRIQRRYFSRGPQSGGRYEIRRGDYSDCG